MISAGKVGLSFINVAFCGLLLTSSISKLIMLSGPRWELDYMVRINNGNYESFKDFNQEFDCNLIDSYSSAYYPKNDFKRSGANTTFYEAESRNASGSSNAPPKYRCKPRSGRYNNHIYNPVYSSKIDGIYSWGIADKILNSIYGILFTFGFLALEFQSFRAFYNNRMPFLNSLGGRGISYIFVGMLTFEVNVIGIVLPSVIVLFGLILIASSFITPGYKISGIIPTFAKSVNLDTQIYEPLPFYEEKQAESSVKLLVASSNTESASEQC